MKETRIMFKRQRPVIIVLLLFLVCGLAFAQEQAPVKRQAASPPITVAAAGERVRFTAVGAVERMRLEVFDPSGAPVFDTGFKPGNVRDWSLRGTYGQVLPDSTYLCVVTVRELSGRMTFRQGSVLIEGGQAALALEGNGQPEAVETEQALSQRRPAERTAMTVVAHDGRDGQVTSTAGDLTFRTGDLFSGKEREQMRLTEDGKLGIGTSDPQATLDVAGTVRASKGVAFPDGTVLTSATGRAQQMDAKGDPVPLISGSGTTGRLTKWTNGPAETVGDSIVTEASNKIGLGTPSPKARFDIKQVADSFVGGLHLRRNTTNDTWAMYTSSDSKLYMGYATSASGADAHGDFTVVPLVLTPTNMVGIGTNAPAAKLHVIGDVNFTGFRTATAYVPNVIGGFGGNNVTANVGGATIGGGGWGAIGPNRVTDDHGTVGGGVNNRAGDDAGTVQDQRFATVGGGIGNRAAGGSSTVGGGSRNVAMGFFSTVAGGDDNHANGSVSAIGGGNSNTAAGSYTTVAGGIGNGATGESSAVGGGHGNFASGNFSAVPGGERNSAEGDYSFAAGQRSRAIHTGAFVWSDSTTAAPGFFSSTANNQFLIKATGGVGIGTNAPNHQLTIGAPDQPVVTSARVGVYGPGAAYALVRDTTNNIEGLFGADSSGTIYGSMTNHRVLFRVNNTDRLILLPTGHLFITAPGNLIMTSPDGACWQIKVENTGALTTGSVPCP
jgi:hypothetical protein